MLGAWGEGLKCTGSGVQGDGGLLPGEPPSLSPRWARAGHSEKKGRHLWPPEFISSFFSKASRWFHSLAPHVWSPDQHRLSWELLPNMGSRVTAGAFQMSSSEERRPSHLFSGLLCGCL